MYQKYMQYAHTKLKMFQLKILRVERKFVHVDIWYP